MWNSIVYICLILMAAVPAASQQKRIAVAGLVHSHVWGHLKTMVAGESATLVGVAEDNTELIAEAKKLGVSDNLFYTDYPDMIARAKPDIVWAFVENNRHLEIAEFCAPRGIHIIFEKPLASTLEDARKIQTLARKHDVQVITNYQMAWWSSNYAAKRHADSGALGQVWRLRGIVGHGGPGSRGPRSKYFFAWLTDPEQNGGGALIDFGCYNALWSLWYLGKPEKVYAHVNHLRPEAFPKVEDNSTLILSYKQGVGLFEGSWDLPHSFQDLEVFGLDGSVYIDRNGVKVRKERRGPAEELPLEPLPAERAEPIAYMVHVLETGQDLEGLVALDINVDVVEILEAAQRSIDTDRAIALPLQ